MNIALPHPTDDPRDALSEIQKRVLAIVEEQGRVTADEIAEATGLDTFSAFLALYHLFFAHMIDTETGIITIFKTLEL